MLSWLQLLGGRSIRDNQYAVSYDCFRGDKDKITGTWFWDEGS